MIGVGTIQGCYGIEDRRDTFALTAPAHPGPVLYRLRVSSPTAMGCLVAKDADRAVIPRLEKCAKNKGAALDAWVVVMGGSPWYLETRDLSGNSLRTADPYTLEIQATPLPDVGEPDSPQAPVPLALGETKQSFLINAANVKDLDNDYYIVEVPRHLRGKRQLEIVVSDVASDVQLGLNVTDGDGRRVLSRGAPNPGATLRAEVKLKGPGRYFIHLRNVWGTNRIVGGDEQPAERVVKPYTITVNAI